MKIIKKIIEKGLIVVLSSCIWATFFALGVRNRIDDTVLWNEDDCPIKDKE